MIKRLLIVVLALSLLLPCIATADIVSVPLAPSFFRAVYDQPDLTVPPAWHAVINNPGYTLPVWFFDEGQLKTLVVDNQQRPDWLKLIWLEIDYKQLPLVPPEITGQAEYKDPPGAKLLDLVWVRRNEANQSITWLWKVFPQPEKEEIFFPNESFYRLENIARIEVATLCVPLPAAVYPGALLMAGAIGITAWRRYRN